MQSVGPTVAATTSSWLLALSLLLTESAHGETVLITGANSRIGLEFTRQYAENAYLADFPSMIDTPFSVTSMIATLNTVTFEDSGRFINCDGTNAPW